VISLLHASMFACHHLLTNGCRSQLLRCPRTDARKTAPRTYRRQATTVGNNASVCFRLLRAAGGFPLRRPTDRSDHSQRADRGLPRRRRVYGGPAKRPRLLPWQRRSSSTSGFPARLSRPVGLESPTFFLAGVICRGGRGVPIHGETGSLKHPA